MGAYQIPLNADNADGGGPEAEAGDQPSAQGTSAAEPQTPDTWQALLGRMLNMDLGRRQGLTPHDLVDATPLPEELAKYNLKPDEATDANVSELLPFLRPTQRSSVSTSSFAGTRAPARPASRCFQ